MKLSICFLITLFILIQCSQTSYTTVIITSNINGSIRDCGCGGEHFGGFPRLNTFLKHEKENTDSLILIDAGDAFPSFHYPKKNILIRYLMNELGYHFILKADQETDSTQQHHPAVSYFIPSENNDGKNVSYLKQTPLLVFHGDSLQFSQNAHLFKHYPLVILSHSQELKNYAQKNVHFIQTGHDLEFVGKVVLNNSGDIISSELIRLDHTYPEDIELKHTIDRFFTSNEHLPHTLKTFSEKSCKGCHQSQYESWKASKHAKAFHTLEVAGKETDADCLRCHTSNFTLRNNAKVTLPDVQCIACHSGAHLPHKAGFTSFIQPITKNTCTHCHTQKNSPSFQLSSYLKQISH